MLRRHDAFAWLAPVLLLASLGTAVADAPPIDAAPQAAAASRPAADPTAPKPPKAPKTPKQAKAPKATPPAATAVAPASAAPAKPAMDADMAAPAAPKGVKTYEIDPVHSSAEFGIHHILGRVPGRFHDISGTITADAAQITQAKASVTIPTATIDTDNEKRDGHLKSADFFDVATYPDMKFEVTKVEPHGTSGAHVQGNFTLHGVTRPIVLEVKDLTFADMGEGKSAMGFRATTTVNPDKAESLWRNSLRDHAYKIIGDKDVKDIDVKDVHAILSPIWLTKHPTAKKIRWRIGAVLAYAAVAWLILVKG